MRQGNRCVPGSPLRGPGAHPCYNPGRGPEGRLLHIRPFLSVAIYSMVNLPPYARPPPPQLTCTRGFRRDSSRENLVNIFIPNLSCRTFPSMFKNIYFDFDRFRLRRQPGYPAVVHSISLSPRAASVAGIWGPWRNHSQLWGGLLPLSATIPVVLRPSGYAAGSWDTPVR